MIEINLDKSQTRAVEYNRGNLLVIAGPGAGKTRVIIGRMQYLIKNGVLPERILAVTFTNKACEEISERVITSLGDLKSQPTVSTFHSFALRILRDFHDTAGLKKFFTVIDEEAQDQILTLALRTHGIAPTTSVLRRLRSHLDYEKAHVSFPLVPPAIKKELEEDIISVFRDYQKFLMNNDAVDFNDLILYALLIMQGDEEARSKYRNRYDHILLDEFQDINLSQYELTRLLVRDDARVLAVADGDQMIYNWRGSDPMLMSSFLHDFKAEKMELGQNYRSPDEIVYATKSLIAHNKPQEDRKLKIPDELEPRVALLEMEDDEDEAKAVARIINLNLNRGYKPGDMCVIYRMHGFGDDIERELSTHDIPLLRIHPNDEFIREGTDQLISYLRLSQNLFDWDVKSAWDFPRRILNPLEGYRITEKARKLGVSLFKLIGDSSYSLDVSPLAHQRLKRFSKFVEELTVIGEELSPSGYFRQLRRKLETFFSPFNRAEEEKLIEHLSWIAGDWSSLIERLSKIPPKPYVLIMHSGGSMLQLASLMVAKTLKEHMGIQSHITLAHNISEKTWENLSRRVTQDNPLIIMHLGKAEKTDLFLQEFWSKGFSFEMFEVAPPVKGEQYFIALACYRFLIDLLTRMPKSSDERLVFYDLETTGIDTRRCEIIELSALATTLYSDESDTYNSLVKPGSPPPPEITALTGITPEMLTDAAKPSKVITDFSAFSKKSVLVGHNIIGFDNKILERYFPQILGHDFIPESIDTVLWARELFPGKSNRLEALGERFSIKSGDLHRAGEDVRLNRDVFYKLLEYDGMKRGLDFSLEAIIYMALMAYERDDPEKGAGRAFLTAAIRILADEQVELSILKANLDRAFQPSACEELMDKISLLAKEKYPEDPERIKWEQLADHLASLIIHYEERDLGEGINGFINHYALLSESDLLKEGNAVKMMTIHSAKGLEFPIVIIVGLEQGSIPHYLALERLERIEEERRLLYVAMTRAKEKIYLMYTKKRDGKFRPQSMFLQEIPEKLVKRYRNR